MSMNKHTIAILYEGEKTERNIFLAIKERFFSRSEFLFIHMPLSQNLYMLWSKLKEDCFETDMIELARENCPAAKTALENYSRDDFSEIYLFLDLDFHSAKSNLKKDTNPFDCLLEMIDVFSNETENGKLFISYPMIESLKCYNDSISCTVPCFYPFDKGSEFKKDMGSRGNQNKLIKYSPEDWKKLFYFSISKANCLISGEYSLTSYQDFQTKLTQKSIFDAECKKHIPFGRVALISGIPLFLLEYFQESFYQQQTQR